MISLCTYCAKNLTKKYISTGVLTGPDIRNLIASVALERTLTQSQLNGWRALKKVIAGFLGKNRSADYNDSVQEMLYGFKVNKVHMSLKIHFMNSHMDAFARQLPTESDEQGERFHQVCKPFETNYKKKELLSLVSDLCWSLTDNGIEMARNK